VYFYELKLSQTTEAGLRQVRIVAPAFPEVLVYADDEADARRIGSRAIRDAIRDRQAQGQPLPPPLTAVNGKRGIYVKVVGLASAKRRRRRFNK
jgi:hypothetical protein